MEQPPQPDPLPYDWQYVTSDDPQFWKESGRKAVVDVGVQARLDRDSIVLGSIFQELVRAALQKRIDPGDAGAVARELMGEAADQDVDLAHSSFDPQLLFLDCLSVLTEHDAKTHSPSHLRDLVFATGVPPDLVRQHLDAPVLEALGMIRHTFPRVSIRKTTNLLYRQSNYNLLREETEGYSKLMTELFTTSNNEPPSSEVVQESFERIKALVGAFDLDVGRVLDVTLDVFASVLVKQYRFFVKLLRASSWWPKDRAAEGLESVNQGSGPLPSWALPDSSGWQTSDETRQELAELRTQRDRAFWDRARDIGMAAFFQLNSERVSNTQSGEGPLASKDEADLECIRLTGSRPPPGNRVAAQLLGFKLRFYASSARDPSDTLPVNLIYLAALLIKIRFISLRDLYPHLYPADDDMEAVKAERFKEKAEKEKLNRPGGGANALMMAGALSDDTYPPTRLREMDGNRGPPGSKQDPASDKPATAAKAEGRERLPEPVEQKVQLLKSLLCIGALPEALFILGRFPWLPDAFPDMPEYIHRILHHSLSKVYDSLRLLTDRESLRKSKKIAESDQAGAMKGPTRLVDLPSRKVLRWALPDKEDASEPADYRFYWDDWSDNIPICQDVDDVFTLCSTLLTYSGVKIGKDPALIMKLTRIGKKSLADDPSEANHARWIDLSKRILVPALSLTKSSPGVVNEVYDLLKNFGTKTRYAIYAEWYLGSISRLPDIKAAFDQAMAETKDVLKRISKTNVKLMARALAKVAYASPGIVFRVAIGQIESYDNLVEVVVECARYFTFLGYDVLTWSLMTSLGAKGRNRVQADGMLTSRWLGALSLFAGRVFKRYHVLMNPTPILQYVTDQLKKSNSTDLIVLKEIITSMAGIVSDSNLNESQILAMAGGDLLRQQTLLQILDRRHESRNTARRLMRSLTEPKLAGQLLISIAQELQTSVFSLPENDAHLKLLGNLFDEIYRVLAQYLDLLRSNLSVKDFDALVPDVPTLILDFGLDPNLAFWIGRVSIAAGMSEADKIAEKTSQQTDATKPVEAERQSDGDVKMSHDRAEHASTEVQPAESSPGEDDMTTEDLAGEVEKVATGEALAANASAEVNGVDEPWHPTIRTLMEHLRPTLSDKVWSNLSLSFYTTFWQLSLYDVQVHTKSYDEEMTRLKNKWMAVRDDRSDMSTAGMQKKEERKKYLTDMQDQLRDELKAHIQAFSRTKVRLSKEKEHWFADFFGRWDVLNLSIIQYCLIPRVLLSPHDALFSFKMLKTLHSIGAPNFRTIGIIDGLLRESRLANTIFICTAREAENLARFLNELLRDLGRWHADRAVYEKEAFGSKRELTGFVKKMSKSGVPESFLEYEDFRRLLYKWHKHINTALKVCLTSGEYMHIRNAIVVLKGIHQYFPAVNWNGRDQLTSVTELINTEKREDLKIAATSLLGNLKRREKQWMLPQAFNLVSITTG